MAKVVGGRDYPRNWHELQQFFPTERACLLYLAKLRWPDRFECPSCGHDRYWLRADGLFLCCECRRKTSPTAGTVFEGTRTPLRTWFAAIWYVTNQSGGVSALGMQRVLGIGSYETAWGMLHKLRRAMQPTSGLLSGTVEVDESFVGGEEPGVKGRFTRTKAKVIIAAERRTQGGAAGRVRLQRIDDFTSKTLISFIMFNVTPGSLICTDGLSAYRGLQNAGYRHEVYNVKRLGVPAHEVLPVVHRVSSQLKRWLMGTHQGAASKELLDFYLAEFAFRFNRRTSRHRGLLFYRLIQQAAHTSPKPYADLLTPKASRRRKTKVTKARNRRKSGVVGPRQNVSRPRPTRPGGPRTTLKGSPAQKRRLVVGGRRGGA